MSDKLKDLLQHGPIVINVGVYDFFESLKIQGVDVIHLNWTPPAGGRRPPGPAGVIRAARPDVYFDSVRRGV